MNTPCSLCPICSFKLATTPVTHTNSIYDAFVHRLIHLDSSHCITSSSSPSLLSSHSTFDSTSSSSSHSTVASFSHSASPFSLTWLSSSHPPSPTPPSPLYHQPPSSSHSIVSSTSILSHSLPLPYPPPSPLLILSISHPLTPASPPP